MKLRRLEKLLKDVEAAAATLRKEFPERYDQEDSDTARFWRMALARLYYGENALDSLVVHLRDGLAGTVPPSDGLPDDDDDGDETAED